MNDEPIDTFEHRLASLRTSSAPPGLRSAVLADVRRELRAARWDRRLARGATLLLLIGVVLNGALVLDSRDSNPPNTAPLASESSRDSILETAVAIAAATNAETGSQYARHLAALSGRTLTGDDLAAIDAAIEQQSHRTPLNGEG